MEDRTVLRLGLLATFALIVEFAYEIGYYWATPIRGAPVLLLGITIVFFIYITHQLSRGIA